MTKFVALGVWLLLVGCSSTPTSTTPSPHVPDLQIANSSTPGEKLDLSQLAVPGKTTLIEFYSDQCPPCHEMLRVMEYLAASRSDLAIRRINIDRTGHSGIDFDSPLAEQYAVESVPSFRIFDPQGKEIAQGKAAKDTVREWYSQAQMIQRGQSDPGTRKIMDQYKNSE